MYNFQPRFPLDHVLALVRNVRSGEYDRGDNLLLIGAITGEIGALLKSGSLIGIASDVEAPATIDGCLLALEGLEALEAGVLSDASFDPTPYIPNLLKLIELWLSRRG